MIRYTMFLAMVFGLAIFGLSKLAPAQPLMADAQHVTIVYETAMVGGNHPVVLEQCAKEDCSDTKQN